MLRDGTNRFELLGAVPCRFDLYCVQCEFSASFDDERCAFAAADTHTDETGHERLEVRTVLD